MRAPWCETLAKWEFPVAGGVLGLIQELLPQPHPPPNRGRPSRANTFSLGREREAQAFRPLGCEAMALGFIPFRTQGKGRQIWDPLSWVLHRLGPRGSSASQAPLAWAARAVAQKTTVLQRHELFLCRNRKHSIQDFTDILGMLPHRCFAVVFGKSTPWFLCSCKLCLLYPRNTGVSSGGVSELIISG